MNPANDKNLTPVSPIVSKEIELPRQVSSEMTEVAKEITTEVVVSTEVAQAGVKKIPDVVEIPPDVRKLGVSPAGPTTPVSATTAFPQVVLPISDQKVVAGLHSQVTSAFLWLATWCIKKLKKAHIALKVIHGKIIRVASN
jgi:hypothetical protein